MIKQVVATTCTWFALAVATSLYARQQQENTLGALWPRVEEHYPGIGARLSAVEAAKLQERAAKGLMLPQVKAQAQNTYGTYEGGAGAFFPQPGLFNVNGTANAVHGGPTAANSFGSATVEWELFSFGKLRKETQAASTLLRKTISEKDAYLLDLKKTLSERYIALLYNDAMLAWTERNAERLRDIRDVTAGLSAAGIRPAADSLLASSSYVQALGEHDKWEGFKQAASIRLSELLGNDSVDHSASALRFEAPESQVGDGEDIDPSHPILDALDRQSRYYTFSGQAQKRAALPSFRLLGGYAYRGTGIGTDGAVSGAWIDGFNHTASNFLVGIGITWNITGLRTERLKGEGLLKEAESTKLLRSRYDQAMRADLAASKSKKKQQYLQLQKATLAVARSRDAYDMYLARYKSGLMSLGELLQIRILLEQAEGARIEASRDYWTLLAYEAELTADFDFLFNNL